MELNLENIIEFIKENSIVIMFALIVISLFYINMKVNNIDYKLHNAIMYNQRTNDY